MRLLKGLMLAGISAFTLAGCGGGGDGGGGGTSQTGSSGETSQTGSSGGTSQTASLEDLYGTLTLNYSFYTSPTRTYTDSTTFTSASKRDSSLVQLVTGSSTRAIGCGLNTASDFFPYTYLCVIGSVIGGLEIFAINVSSNGVVTGIYEYCDSGDTQSCISSLITAPDGAVSGKFVKGNSASSGSSGGSTIYNYAQHDGRYTCRSTTSSTVLTVDASFSALSVTFTEVTSGLKFGYSEKVGFVNGRPYYSQGVALTTRAETAFFSNDKLTFVTGPASYVPNLLAEGYTSLRTCSKG